MLRPIAFGSLLANLKGLVPNASARSSLTYHPTNHPFTPPTLYIIWFIFTGHIFAFNFHLFAIIIIIHCTRRWTKLLLYSLHCHHHLFFCSTVFFSFFFQLFLTSLSASFTHSIHEAKNIFVVESVWTVFLSYSFIHSFFCTFHFVLATV